MKLTGVLKEQVKKAETKEENDRAPITLFSCISPTSYIEICLFYSAKQYLVPMCLNSLQISSQSRHH